jgi:hypothetical protein
VSKSIGAAEEFAVEDADLNQATGDTIESRGNFSNKITILIKGVPVDKASALRWSAPEMSEVTGLSRKLVESAPEASGWVPPRIYKDPNGAFMRAMLRILRDDPQHPLRFLVEKVAAAAK